MNKPDLSNGVFSYLVDSLTAAKVERLLVARSMLHAKIDVTLQLVMMSSYVVGALLWLFFASTVGMKSILFLIIPLSAGLSLHLWPFKAIYEFLFWKKAAQ